jgi:hypothetical protein
VIASHRRLDETRAIAVAAASERQQCVARMRTGAHFRQPGSFASRLRRRRAEVAGDRLADHLAQFLIIHERSPYR